MGAEPLQHALLSARWWPLQERDEPGKLRAEIESIELCEINYQASSWSTPRRIIGMRQHIKTRPQAKGKTLSLFAEDMDVSGWRYGAIVSDLQLPAVGVWRTYRGRANCENRIIDPAQISLNF